MVPWAHPSPQPKQHRYHITHFLGPTPVHKPNSISVGSAILGRPLHVQVTFRPMPWDRFLSRLSVMLVYCGQTVEWIKMPLGTEVDLDPGHTVLDGGPSSPNGNGHTGTTASTFRPLSIVAKRPPISATAKLLLHSS